MATLKQLAWAMTNRFCRPAVTTSPAPTGTRAGGRGNRAVGAGPQVVRAAGCRSPSTPTQSVRSMSMEVLTFQDTPTPAPTSRLRTTEPVLSKARAKAHIGGSSSAAGAAGDGLALAIAVAVDAIVVRCLLVSVTTMTLLRGASWWAPPFCVACTIGFSELPSSAPDWHRRSRRPRRRTPSAET